MSTLKEQIAARKTAKAKPAKKAVKKAHSPYRSTVTDSGVLLLGFGKKWVVAEYVHKAIQAGLAEELAEAFD